MSVVLAQKCECIYHILAFKGIFPSSTYCQTNIPSMIGLSFRSKPVQYSDFILFRQFGEPSHSPLKIFPST